MAQDDNLPSLESLQKRLEQATPEAPEETETVGESASDMAVLSRLAVDLLAGVVVGIGAGWLLDHWLGTSPWLLITCFFLGFAGGFLNMKRASEALDKEQV